MGLLVTANAYSSEFQCEQDWQDLKKMLDDYRGFNDWLRHTYPSYCLDAMVSGNPANLFEVMMEILIKSGEKK